MNDHYLNTIKYYSKWTDIDFRKFDQNSIIFKKSYKRTIRQIGYSNIFKGYIYLNPNNIIFSYCTEIEDKVNIVKKSINLQNIYLELSNSGFINYTICKKFFFHEKPIINDDEVVQITIDNKNKFIDFMIETNNLKNNETWIEPYFISNIAKNSLWGIFDKGKIISCSESPDLPYFKNRIIEPGINTLKEYRNMGYGKKVISKFLSYNINKGKTPIWSCGKSNIASYKLAESLGFKELAEVILIS